MNQPCPNFGVAHPTYRGWETEGRVTILGVSHLMSAKNIPPFILHRSEQSLPRREDFDNSLCHTL